MKKNHAKKWLPYGKLTKEEIREIENEIEKIRFKRRFKANVTFVLYVITQSATAGLIAFVLSYSILNSIS